MILNPAVGLFGQGTGRSPTGYEISDHRLTHGLMKGKMKIFRLPSNAELNEPADRYIYRTREFPEWKLCLNEKEHKGNFDILYNDRRGCPVCKRNSKDFQEQIRFIVACKKGHIDDVAWTALVHNGTTGCQHSGYLQWSGGGGALNEIFIQCPKCSARTTMGTAYAIPWHCTGRHPENELPYGQAMRNGCDARAWIVQRQASNLRIPELKTLLTIPPRHTNLHNLLQKAPVYAVLKALGGRVASKQVLGEYLNNLKGEITQANIDEILAHPWPEITAAISDVLSQVSTEYDDLILEEFHAFLHTSKEGCPPAKGPPPRSQVIFRVNPAMRKTFSAPAGKRRKFSVTPILTMRTVTVQTGYRREVDPDVAAGPPSEVVDVGFPDQSNGTQSWYPGIEYLGEGIFITLDDNDGWHYNLSNVESWSKAYGNGIAYPDHVFRDEKHRHELHPVFVWWHTLSHLLIRSVSLEAGYSSAAIRERIYLERNGDRTRGGIVLYSTQPGSEGTLGGLIALVPHFDAILNSAFEVLESCSNDPLCIDKSSRFVPGKYNGAACYGCLLVSETSCEHRNMWLDRNVLRDNLP